MKLKYFSHSAFRIIADNGKTILIDPFFDGNPTSPVKSDDVDADYIILTHAHGDHIGDAFKIAKRGDSLFICVNELANYCAEKGFRAHNMHVGGGYNFDFGRVKFTIAHHSSVAPDGVYCGPAAGVLITIGEKTIYHTGDTGLFLDMKLIGEINHIDVMLLPIGDNFTMGIEDAAKAVDFVHPKMAIPMHYNTFGVIEADPAIFISNIQLQGNSGCVLKYGEEITV